MNTLHRIRDFHGSRLTGIGASDIPTLAGFNKGYKREYKLTRDGSLVQLFQTPYTLYLEKTGQVVQVESGERAEWGHRLEPIILAKWIENRYGKADGDAYLAARLRDKSYGPYKSQTETRMPGRRYVLAHPDLIVLEGEGINVEGKSTGFYAGKRREGEAFIGYDPDDVSQQGIPDPVFLQVQYQNLSADIPVASVAVLIDTGDYREYGPIISDPRTQEKCLALAERMWWCVKNNKPPKPEVWGDIANMWPTPNEKTAMLGGEEELAARALCDEYWRLGEKIDKHEGRRAEIKKALGVYIGENSILATPNGTKLASSWVQLNAPSVDLKKLKEKEPDIYDRLMGGGYVKQGERRELRPAKIKGE